MLHVNFIHLCTFLKISRYTYGLSGNYEYNLHGIMGYKFFWSSRSVRFPGICESGIRSACASFFQSQPIDPFVFVAFVLHNPDHF